MDLSVAAAPWFYGAMQYLRSLGLAACAALLLAKASMLSASVLVAVGIDELAVTSDAVILATVQSTSSRLLPSGHIVTDVELSIGAVVAGTVDGDELTLTEDGGTVGDEIEVVSGSPQYIAGETALVFLEQRTDGSVRTAQMVLGKFRVEASGSGGLLARRSYDSTTHVLLPTGVDSDQPVLRLDEALARVRAARPDAPPVALGVAAMPSPLGGGGFTYGNPKARLFEADLGMALPFRIDQRGDSTLGLAKSQNAVSAGLRAWTDVDGASLTLSNAGLTTQLSTPCPDPNGEPFKVRFNNPDGTIANPVECHGMLALTRYRANTAETKTLSGESFGRIRCADVTFASGWGACLIWTECNLAEIAAHELGHAIGFGHSADPDATMNAVAHFDGRCAALRSDDTSAVSFVYPPAAPPSQLVADVLPPATGGQPYSEALEVTGGVPPYAWSLERSDYCGLAVAAEGVLEGTPAGCLCRSRATAAPPTPAPSPFVFIKVSDAKGDSHTRFVHVPFAGSTPGTPLPTCTPTASRTPTATRTPTLPATTTPTRTESPLPTDTPTPTVPATSTPTETPTNNPTPTETAAPLPCAGDCDGSREVTVDEIIQLVNQALGLAALNCTAGDRDGDGSITIDEILVAVNSALAGCPVSPTQRLGTQSS